MTATELAATARRFMEGGPSGAGAGAGKGVDAHVAASGPFEFWPRAAALLARQALEQGLDDLWGARAPRVREASRHAQLLCLGAFVPDEELVSGVRHAWHGLSRACHHQQYELAPTAGELGRWLDDVERLLAHDPMG